MEESKEDYMIRILQAFTNGAVVKFRYPKTDWVTVSKDHKWNFYKNEYEIFIPRLFVPISLRITRS